MKEKEETKLVGQLLILDLFAIICGYYFITTIDALVKQNDWQADLLVMLIVICEMAYNWIQILRYKNKVANLIVILTSVTLSAVLSGIYISEIWLDIQGGQNYRNHIALAILWIGALVIGNAVLWKRYKKNN